MRAAIYKVLRDSLDAGELVTFATVLAGPGLGNQLVVWPAGQTRGDLGGPRLNQRAAIHAQQAMRGSFSKRASFDTEQGAVEVFFELLPPADRLVIVGAVHVAIPLCEFACRMDFRTIVVDPRAAFATAERFAAADEILDDWPDVALRQLGIDESTYIVLLSHDPKLDMAALEIALRSPAPYVGALGSKKTAQKRRVALEEAGFSADEIDRIHAPIGLDLGGRKAEEIALSVMAEIVAVKHGRDRRRPPIARTADG